MKIPYKQYIIVPKDPHMSTGKVASQAAHATFMALEKQREDEEGKLLIDDWKEKGMCVITLECPTQQELWGIAEYCKQWNIEHHLYIDEGHTEIPMGTATALATGVVKADQYWMFDTMKLYNDDKPKIETKKKKKLWGMK